ncbi:PTS sugar transporter subunit IIA [Companilactobacillus allii]|nr:PTS sugar transporter subunit IIA [Companilactobacillus allii]USQ68616.1 PTS sugar transporter subunit IIA [Companilactobacillus allii]
MVSVKGYSYMVKDNLVNLNIHAKTENDVFDYVGNQLISKGYANAGYIEAVKNRENEFPTGLAAPKITLAVPHVDPEFVKSPFIFIGRTENPVKIKQMAINTEIETSNFCFLGIKEGSGQAGLLKNIIYALRNDDFINKLETSRSETELVELYRTYLDKEN